MRALALIVPRRVRRVHRLARVAGLGAIRDFERATRLTDLGAALTAGVSEQFGENGLPARVGHDAHGLAMSSRKNDETATPVTIASSEGMNTSIVAWLPLSR